MMPFESHGNGMKGMFCYAELEERLKAVRKAIDNETEMWCQQGQKSHENTQRVESNLKHQYEQCQEHFSKTPNGITITIEHEKDNPFVWTIVHPPSYIN